MPKVFGEDKQAKMAVVWVCGGQGRRRMHNRKWEEIRAEKSGRENEGCEEPTRKEVSKDVTLYAGEEK